MENRNFVVNSIQFKERSSSGAWRRRHLSDLTVLGLAFFAFGFVSIPICGFAQTTESGSSSRQNREHAAKLIPFQNLNQPTRDKLSEVIDGVSLYRRLPADSIVADPDYFRFLVRYPEVLVNIWQLMGVTQMTTVRTGPFQLDTDDGSGTVSTLDLVYGNDNLHIYYGVGTYEGPVLRRKVNGRCVLILRNDNRVDATGQNHVISQLDIFLKLDNVGANLMAKTVQPIVGPTADQNFLDSLKFVQRLNETTANNGPGVQHMAHRLNVDEEVRQRFIEAAGLVYERNLKLKASINDPRLGDTSMNLRSPNSPASTTVPTHYETSDRNVTLTDHAIPAYLPTPGYGAPAYGRQP